MILIMVEGPDDINQSQEISLNIAADLFPQKGVVSTMFLPNGHEYVAFIKSEKKKRMHSAGYIWKGLSTLHN